jgi:hypothetical protein
LGEATPIGIDGFYCVQPILQKRLKFQHKPCVCMQLREAQAPPISR